MPVRNREPTTRQVADEALIWALLRKGASGAGSGNPALIVWKEISPPGLYALPNDNSLSPEVAPYDVSYYFTAPRDLTISSVQVKGDAVALGSVNGVYGPATSAPHVTSHAIESSGSSTVLTLSATVGPVAKGDSLYICVVQDGGFNVNSITDTEGNGYTLRAYTSFGSTWIMWWQADNVPAAASVTMTANLGSPAHCVVMCLDITGTNPGGSFDVAGAGPTNSNSDTVTPTENFDLCLLGVADLDDAGTYSAVLPSTLIDENPGDGGATQPLATADLSQPGGAAGSPITLSAAFSGSQTPGNYGALALAILGIGPAEPIDLDLYVNGSYVATLATIPAGQATFNVVTNPGVVIPAGSLYQLIVDFGSAITGEAGNFLVNVGLTG